MGETEIKQVLDLVPGLVGLLHSTVWTFYDKEADVLYVDFKKPSHADDAELTDDNVLIRYEGDKVVGFTIMDASKRKGGVIT